MLILMTMSYDISVIAQTASNKLDQLLAEYARGYTSENSFANVSSWQREETSARIKAINSLPDSVKSRMLALARSANKYTWPSLPAAEYLRYKHIGDRQSYEKFQSTRREMLYRLVVGEILEDQHRFIPQIVNGLWLILEESSWVSPAHIGVQSSGLDLPDIEQPIIDLNSSRTALELATIYNLLHSKIQIYSKVVNRRIEVELQNRIFNPYMKTSYSWMGFNNKKLNNWNTFINSNCLQAGLLVLNSDKTLAPLIEKIIKSSDKFLNQYPNDGGCSEGPLYWDMSGGKLAQLLSTLTSFSKGRVDWSRIGKLKRIASYPYKVQIADEYTLNFSDATGKFMQNPYSVYRYGLMFNDDTLKNFAAYLLENGSKQFPVNSISAFVEASINYQELSQISSIAPYPKFVVFPDLQIHVARVQNGTTEGLFFALKGGGNAENHNHNDVGNLILFSDGKPVLIDAGVGVYNNVTFSKQRYEVWNVQSQWHNCPTINGVNQNAGERYRATSFRSVDDSLISKATMDISGAYSSDAEIKGWIRDVTLYRKQNRVTLIDSVRLATYKEPTILNFLTPSEVEVYPGYLLFKTTGVRMTFNPEQFSVTIEQKILNDVQMKKIWGGAVFRVQMVSKGRSLSNSYELSFQKK